MGAGKVAVRKASMLIKSNPVITFIAPDTNENILKLKNAYNIEIIKRNFEAKDIDTNYDFVFACSNNREVNKLVSELSHQKKIPVNIADSLEESSFIMPAVLLKDDMMISISTYGKNPVKARMIRLKLKKWFSKLK